MKILRTVGTAVLATLFMAAAASAVQVTFTVNMNAADTAAAYNFDPASDQLVVRGGFNAWSGVTHELTDGDADGIYTGTFDLTASTTFEYKFAIVYGAGGSDKWEESIGNRSVQVLDSDFAVAPTWFDKYRPDGGDVYTTFKVNMNYQSEIGSFDAASDSVWLAGQGGPLNWNPGGDNLLMTDADGDLIYSITLQLPDGTYDYKTPMGAAGSISWENALNGDGTPNQIVITATTPGDTSAIHWWDSVEPPSDFAQVSFSVDMSFAAGDWGIFDPAADVVAVRGGFNSWETGEDSVLTDIDGDGIYTGTFTIPVKTDAAWQWKYVIVYAPDSVRYEVNNRDLSVVDTNPVNLNTVYFDDQEPTAVVDISVLFQVDMSVAIGTGQFDDATDNVMIRGGHAKLGSWGGFDNDLAAQTGTNIYAIAIAFENMPVGTDIPYKFVIDDGGDDTDPVTWESLPPRAEYEGDNRHLIVPNATSHVVPVTYWDDNPGGLDSDMLLTIELDTRAAFYKFDAEGIEGITAINFFAIAGPWNSWPWGQINPGDPEQLYDDGTNGDATADDSIYTYQTTLVAGTAVNYTYKFGINSLDNEAESGTNHFAQFFSSTTDTTLVDTFGIIGTLYDGYVQILDVREISGAPMPQQFELAQNYPNPFNPATTISFRLPQGSEAVMKVFNIMGQEVMRHEFGRLTAGAYEMTIDASQLSSGVYFYRLEAGDHVATKKMMLLK